MRELIGHFRGWIVVAVTWALFAHHMVHEWSMRTATTASTWFSADIGAWYTISFGMLILLAGTLQWYLLGRLVQWTAGRKGQRTALLLLAVYGLWAAAALFLWVAAHSIP